MCEVREYYDHLIDMNNDPVLDPKPLQYLMNKWDGQDFIDRMELDISKTVLEFAVGSGRLAIRTAPLCKDFYGIDISPKTIERAKEHLSKLDNISLVCGDFFDYEFEQKFDVIYSSLTFMHIKEKQKALNKISGLLKHDGRFVLSIDKNQDRAIRFGDGYEIEIFPDNPVKMKKYIASSGLNFIEQYETELAHIFVAVKASNSYCGHDCSRCITYIATKNDDNDLREQSRRFYNKEFGRDIPIEQLNCTGCKSDKAFILCNECPFRKCCNEQNILSCDECSNQCGMIKEYKIKYVNKCNQVE